MSLDLKLGLHFKIQDFWWVQIIILSITDFGVSTAIFKSRGCFAQVVQVEL